MEGEEVIGLAKCKEGLPRKSEANPHWHDWANFFHLKMANAIAPINYFLVVDVGKTRNHVLVITHNGAKVLKCLCGDGIWRIKHYPPQLNTHCSTLQKDIKHYYKAKIISKQINHGIFSPCYVGYWFVTKGVSIELHKFWFCHDDLICCVGRINEKYALDKLILLSFWSV